MTIFVMAHVERHNNRQAREYYLVGLKKRALARMSIFAEDEGEKGSLTRKVN